MVLSDDPVTYPPIHDGTVGDVLSSVGIPPGFGANVGWVHLGIRRDSPTLHFRQAGALAASAHESVTAFVKRRSIRSSSTVFREFDPQRPNAPLTSERHRSLLSGRPEAAVGAVLSMGAAA